MPRASHPIVVITFSGEEAYPLIVSHQHPAVCEDHHKNNTVITIFGWDEHDRMKKNLIIRVYEICGQ
jgi:hypothetical protein